MGSVVSLEKLACRAYNTSLGKVISKKKQYKDSIEQYLVSITHSGPNMLPEASGDMLLPSHALAKVYETEMGKYKLRFGHFTDLQGFRDADIGEGRRLETCKIVLTPIYDETAHPT